LRAECLSETDKILSELIYHVLNGRWCTCYDCTMSLLQFRVQNFRSIVDSNWIRCDEVTTLVGMNEAGKSNLLLALWKLNPAKGGEVNLFTDMPRRIFSTSRSKPETITFIEADFRLSNEDSQAIKKISLVTSEAALEVRVSKDFGNNYKLKLQNASSTKSLTYAYFNNVLNKAVSDLEGVAPETAETEAEKEDFMARLTEIRAKYPNIETRITLALLNEWSNHISNWYSIKNKEVSDSIYAVISCIRKLKKYFEAPEEVDGVEGMILKAIPKFVYYSNYGNLDSDIYLPQAIASMNQASQTGIAEAKARTVRVLFEFVGLDADEILEMGKDPVSQGEPSTDDTLKQTSNQKAARHALLDQAQRRLSAEFEKWWKQGEVRFEFRADGDYFRILVADKQRPEPIELENRSTGLQWFLSFFLIFTVESGGEHSNTVLLLDEAGHSLHPLAQRDLSKFFSNLSENNQIIHSTQSPFLVDTDHIDRVRAVFLDQGGYTVVAEDLREAERIGKQPRSVYAVHAALGLSVSDILLQGCLAVIVEGVSDQVYFNAIKNWLIHTGKIKPNVEIIFAPTGGTTKVKPITSLLAGRDNSLPPIVLDSDKAGTDLKSALKAEVYKAEPKKLIAVGDFVTISDAEVEDLIPIQLLKDTIEKKLFRDTDDSFADVYDSSKPIIGQLESFAEQRSIALENGWKVILAKGFKSKLLGKSPPTIDKEAVSTWQKLFKRILT
jgi:predicted ATP-dependent endonuclease of OLD family